MKHKTFRSLISMDAREVARLALAGKGSLAMFLF